MTCILVHVVVTVIVSTALKALAWLLVACNLFCAFSVFGITRLGAACYYLYSNYSPSVMASIAVLTVFDAGFSKVFLVCVAIALSWIYFVRRDGMSTVVALACVVAYVIVCGGFFQALILTVLAVGLVLFIGIRSAGWDAYCYLPIAMVGVLFLLQVKEVTSQVDSPQPYLRCWLCVLHL